MGGQEKPTDREAADALAIGGMRNAAGSVSRMHFLAALGQKMGQAMRDALMDNLSKHRQQSDLNEQDAWITGVSPYKKSCFLGFAPGCFLFYVSGPFLGRTT